MVPAGQDRAELGRAGAPGERCYLARGAAVTPGPQRRQLPAARATRTAPAEGQTTAARGALLSNAKAAVGGRRAHGQVRGGG